MTNIRGTDLDIFPLGLGGNTFGGNSDAATSEEVLDAFLDRGGNFIDTADQYAFWIPGNQGGESETILGTWMQRRGLRDRVIVATKVGGMPTLKGLAPHTITTAVEDSLRRLQTDTIDLYYAHFDDTSQTIESIATSFDALVKAGKVRYVGVSNMAGDRIEAWIQVARENGLAVPVALQPEYNLVERRGYEHGAGPLAARHGLAVFPYFSLASGFLSGKYRTRADLQGAARGKAVEAYLTDDGLAVVEALGRIASARGAAMATVALAWLLAKPTVTAPLASATSVEQLEELMAAPGLALSAADVAALDDASQPFA